MQITYCDYCRERINEPKELVKLTFNLNASAQFTCAEKDLHLNCAHKLKSFMDGFLKANTEVENED